MDPATLRAEFPVLAQFAYLNAGTCGPLPAAALRAGADAALAAAEHGRGMAYFEHAHRISGALRARYARVLGAAPQDVALTLATSDGMARVLASLDLRAGDVVLTAPDEHPGLLGPLGALARLRGVTIRTAPLAQLADAVTADTTLVACSHVSWITGALAPAALADVGRSGVPVLLDGAQGAGAIPIDLEALGCCAYAAAGQKWLCGPVGTGMLWIAPAWRERLAPTSPTYPNLAEPNAGLDAQPWPDARAHDAAAFPAQTLAAAEASAGVLEEAGWDAVWDRAATLAAGLADALRERGRVVAPRDRTTLVAWEDADPPATAARMADAGVLVRHLPGHPYVRASVGAWNDESDLERLLAALDA
jgi:L-cysteine/cystine lyase